MRILVIALFIAGAASTIKAFDVMKLKRMLKVTMQRNKPVEKTVQEKHQQLEKILESDKPADARIEIRSATPKQEKYEQVAKDQSGEKQKITKALVDALQSVVDIIEKQLDRAVNSKPELYLPEKYHKAPKEAMSAITADITPITSAKEYLQDRYELYQANALFNALLRILYYTNTKGAQGATELQIMFYHPEGKAKRSLSDSLFAGELSKRIIKALIEIKNLDENFKPTANKDSNQLEIKIIEQLNSKSPHVKWAIIDFNFESLSL